MHDHASSRIGKRMGSTITPKYRCIGLHFVLGQSLVSFRSGRYVHFVNTTASGGTEVN